jgi:prolipoprotein diacylglyceryltransferase
MRTRHHPGVLACVFGVWYATGRVWTDFLRVERRFYGLTGSQWACLGAIAVCAFLLVRWRIRDGRGSPEGEPPPDAVEGEGATDAGAAAPPQVTPPDPV